MPASRRFVSFWCARGYTYNRAFSRASQRGIALPDYPRLAQPLPNPLTCLVCVYDAVYQRSVNVRSHSENRLRWPLPPLWPEHSAYGVAGLRSGSGKRDSKHALMTESAASESARKSIPLNI